MAVEYIRIPVRRFKRTVYGWFNAFPEDYEKQVAAFLKKIDPDIIHIHNRPLLVSYFRERFPRKKIILHMHNLYNYLGRLERPSGPFINEADLFLGCSRFVVAAEKNRLAVGTPGQEVLYNGVDTRRLPAPLGESGGNPEGPGAPRTGGEKGGAVHGKDTGIQRGGRPGPGHGGGFSAGT